MMTIAEMLGEAQAEKLRQVANSKTAPVQKRTPVIIPASALKPQRPEGRGRGWRREQGFLK